MHKPAHPLFSGKSYRIYVERWTLDNAMTPDKTPKTQQEKIPLKESEPTHSTDGVDLTLIRWMLSMTPAERLQTLQQNVQAILRLRGDKAET
jgi:hypothetical protein